MGKIRTGIFAIMLFVRAVAAEDESSDTQANWHEGKEITESTIIFGSKIGVFGDRVYFSGQPKPEHFKVYAEKGVKTVINLRTAQEMKSLDEKTEVEKVGMKYINVPVGGKEPPTAEDLKKIFDALDTAKDAPVLLHCLSSSRVGYVWAAYRGSRHGLEVEAAIKEGNQAGMHNLPLLVEWVKKAIESASKEASAK